MDKFYEAKIIVNGANDGIKNKEGKRIFQFDSDVTLDQVENLIIKDVLSKVKTGKDVIICDLSEISKGVFDAVKKHKEDISLALQNNNGSIEKDSLLWEYYENNI